MKKCANVNKLSWIPSVSKMLVRPRTAGDGIRMMNCTVSTNPWGNNILMVMDETVILKWNSYVCRINAISL